MQAFSEVLLGVASQLESFVLHKEAGQLSVFNFLVKPFQHCLEETDEETPALAVYSLFNLVDGIFSSALFQQHQHNLQEEKITFYLKLVDFILTKKFKSDDGGNLSLEALHTKALFLLEKALMRFSGSFAQYLGDERLCQMTEYYF